MGERNEKNKDIRAKNGSCRFGIYYLFPFVPNSLFVINVGGYFWYILFNLSYLDLNGKNIYPMDGPNMESRNRVHKSFARL